MLVVFSPSSRGGHENNFRLQFHSPFKQCSAFVRAELKNYKQRNLLYYYLKKKSIILIHVQNNNISQIYHYVQKNRLQKEIHYYYYLPFIHISYP